jgi:hypothetical protein
MPALPGYRRQSWNSVTTRHGSGGNVCRPISGGFSTCEELIDDQVQAIFDAKFP